MPGEGGDTWEVVADRWHVGFTDLGGGAGLLGQVEEARQAAKVQAKQDLAATAARLLADPASRSEAEGITVDQLIKLDVKRER